MGRSARDGGLDAMRGIAIAGVVAAHAALSYLVTPIGWAVRDGSRAVAVDLAVWTARQFLMPAFFYLAGAMTARTRARHGAWEVVRRRALRVALPFALLVVPMALANDALWDWGRTLAVRDAVAAPVPTLRAPSSAITLGHLWYLYYLCAITAAALVVDAAGGLAPRPTGEAGRVPTPHRLAALVERLAPRGVRAAIARLAPYRGHSVAPLVLALPTTAMLALAGKLQLDTPLGFAIDPVIAGYFAAFFAWGWLDGDPARAPSASRAALWALGAVAFTAALVPALARATDGAAPRPLELYVAAAGSWLWLGALVEACRWWLAPPPVVLRALAAASYTIYVVHLPLVVLGQLAASQLAVPGPLEWAAIALGALAASLAIHAAITATARRPKRGRWSGT